MDCPAIWSDVGDVDGTGEDVVIKVDGNDREEDDGSAAAAADSADGDSADGDSADGDSADGDSADGDSADGDSADGDSADGDRCLHVSVCLCCIWEGQECLLIPLCGCHVQDRLSDEALDCVEMVSKGDIHSAQC